jgi:hypothetical protein
VSVGNVDIEFVTVGREGVGDGVAMKARFAVGIEKTPARRRRYQSEEIGGGCFGERGEVG